MEIVRKIKHFIRRNILREWPNRILFAVDFLWLEILVIWIVNLSQTQNLLDFNQLLSDFWGRFRRLDVLICYILAQIIFNLGFTFRKVFVLQSLFLVSLVGLNIFGASLKNLYGYDWNFYLTNLFILLATVWTAFSVQDVLVKELAYLKNGLTRYVHPEIMERILSKPDSLELGGRQKNLTVLFCDLRGFTSLAENIPPKRLIEILNQYFNQMSQIVIDNQGTIDKFIGDALMAFWGDPISDGKHSKNALKTALEMMAKLSQIQAQVPEFRNLQIGIGLNSGPMVVGNVGSEYRFDYTVLGDNVNLGARLEALTKVYRIPILISQSVLDEVGNHFEQIIYRVLDEIKVKGKSQSVRIYQPMPRTKQNLEIKRIYENSFFFYQRGEFVQALDGLEVLVRQRDWPSILLLQRIEKIVNGAEFNPVWDWNRYQY
jgi:adenylate cyclase